MKTKKVVSVDDEILKVGTYNCPCHKERLEFEQLYGTRIIRDGYINARCPKTHKHYKAKVK